MNLKSYGGGRLNIIGQIEVRSERGSNQTKVVVQVQKEAPVQLLIGTDLLSSLGVLFLLKEPKMLLSEIQYDLLQNNTTEFVPAIKQKGDGVERCEIITEVLESVKKKCDSASTVCCKHNNCQPENSSSQSGMHSNNNCQLENSGSPSGMHNNNNNCQSENSGSHLKSATAANLKILALNLNV